MDSDLPLDKNLLIIGGTGRNVGKTSLALMLLKKYKESRIIGLKVSAHRKNEEYFHGSHEFLPVENYKISIETGNKPWKDTAQMVNAGAIKAFYIESADEKIPEAYIDFRNNHNNSNLPVICESRSLRKHIIPGVYILLISSDNVLQDSEIAKADLVHYTQPDSNELLRLAEQIKLTETGWTISKK